MWFAFSYHYLFNSTKLSKKSILKKIRFILDILHKAE